MAAGTSTDQFKARDVIVDTDGTEHVRFDRFYGGLPVIGGDVVVSSKQGQLQQPSMTLASPINLTSASAKQGATSGASDIGAAGAEKIAIAQFASSVDRTDSPVKIIFARNTSPVLAYQVKVYGPSTSDHSSGMRYSIDARTGRVLETESLILQSAATGVGKTYFYGDVALTTDQLAVSSYRMLDPNRGNGSVHDGANNQDYAVVRLADGLPIYTSTTNTWGNNATSNRQTVAADIDYGLAITWDYYKTIHGRSGVADDGKGVRSFAHVLFGTGADKGSNAEWSSGIMMYGDGGPYVGNKPVVTIDVAGHEMTHGVTENTANLAYTSADSGGLNESTSDIFGTLIKFYANNPKDPGNYVIGAALKSGGLRKMYKQDLDGYSSSCYPSGGFNVNPHYSSGVGNRFFYLLAEGATVPSTDPSLTKNQLVCNGDTTLAGVGRDKAGKIWYRTLSLYLTSGSTYPDARAASIRAAGDLYGPTSVEAQTVAKTWDAVNVK